MIAANIMTTEVSTLTSKNTVEDAVKLLKDKKVRVVPIVDEEKKVIGAITSRTLMRCILPGYISRGYLKDVKFAPELQQFIDNIEGLAKIGVCDFMASEQVIENPGYAKISPETSVMEVAAIFVNPERLVESILVVDNMERLLGIVTPVDAFKRLWEFAGKNTKTPK
jgi:CBS-domain-containing membrane protein